MSIYQIKQAVFYAAEYLIPSSMCKLLRHIECSEVIIMQSIHSCHNYMLYKFNEMKLLLRLSTTS